MNDEEKAPRIVVRDRRAFTQDGARRPDAEPREAPAPLPREAEAEARVAGAGSPQAEDPRFRQLVSFLYSQAVVLLEQEGARPGEATRAEAQRGLQQVIGLLEWIEEKTRGQLSQADTKVISQVLYELRMAYMNRTRPPNAPKQPPRR